MPMLAPVMAQELTTILAGSGMLGSETPNFAQAVALGCVGGIVGSPFQTSDTGFPGAPGVGVGAGVLGVAGPTLGAAIFAELLKAYGASTADTKLLADGIGNALFSQLTIATLTHQNPAVYAGVGIIVPGTIAIDAQKIGSLIFANGVSLGLLGSEFKNTADAIGQGIQLGFKSASGQVTITGAPPVPPPPATVPGIPGTGVIS